MYSLYAQKCAYISTTYYSRQQVIPTHCKSRQLARWVYSQAVPTSSI